MDRRDIHNSEIPLLCISCEARHKGICGVLNTAELTELSRHTTKITHPAETDVVPAGQPLERYANILSGVVKLSKLTADGRQQIVGMQFAPDFLGRPFVRQSDVGVQAATDVRVCTFPVRVLEKLIKQSPELEHKLHEQALKELDEARDWMLTLGRKTASEKVASFLYMVAAHFNPEAEEKHLRTSFDIPMKRADIADFLGLTIETVSRHITKLRHSGVIVLINNRTVEVPDMARLHRMTEQDLAP
jgi:CRP/FNR family transcriptional regulator, anaerobic regulatory protein